MADEIEKLTPEDERALNQAWAREAWREPFGPDPTPEERRVALSRLAANRAKRGRERR